MRPTLDGTAVSNVYEEHEYKLRVTFGTNVITSYRSKDATISRNSAGNYTVTLPIPYNEIVSFYWGFQDASGAILFAVIKSETVSTDGNIVIETRTEAGTATDPTSGDKLLFVIGVSDNQLNDKFTG